jgi:tryptophan synthase alpha chain
MSRIPAIFKSLSASGQSLKALMPFVCGGFPKPGLLPDVLVACEQGGGSIIEVGLPFSDPIADGPTIAAAMHDALQAGSTPASVLDEIALARPRVSAGIVAMVSMSIVHRMGGAAGPAAFAKLAASKGVDGLIVPDCPLEEATQLREACNAHNLTLSLLIAPATPLPRAEKIAQLCSGFVYVLARAGITGESAASPAQANTSSAPSLSSRIDQLRTITKLPLAVGFGISTAQQVASVVEKADAAIVGSTIVRAMRDAHAQRKDVAIAAKNCVASLAEGLYLSPTSR